MERRKMLVKFNKETGTLEMFERPIAEQEMLELNREQLEKDMLEHIEQNYSRYEAELPLFRELVHDLSVVAMQYFFHYEPKAKCVKQD